ncbi:MAG: hypothetical protein PHS41_01630 [Victivallaceae bacterium]|nr:hypothetical protein [Victivallaceae bacterium]
MNAHDFDKYLRKNPARPISIGASPEALFAERIVAVVPVLDEKEELPGVLSSLEASAAAAGAGAVLLVFNHTPETDALKIQHNRELLDLLAAGKLTAGGLPLGWMDAGALRYGVGEARKIGCDSLLAHWPRETLSERIFAMLDADSPVEVDYFGAILDCFRNGGGQMGAVTLGFRHRQAATTKLEEAIRRYEDYLREFCRRLKEANSPYAFVALGSAIACSAELYCRAGGMKRKNAGEDFYFLESCRKIAPVTALDRELVHPSARISDRVPFGTGPALKGMLEGSLRYVVPPEEAWTLLGQILRESRNPELLRGQDGEAYLKKLPEEGRAYLIAEGFRSMWPKILRQRANDAASLPAEFDRWFDGLRTIRLLNRFQLR